MVADPCIIQSIIILCYYDYVTYEKEIHIPFNQSLFCVPTTKMKLDTKIHIPFNQSLFCVLIFLIL